MAFISMATGDQVDRRPGTVGRPIPLVEVAVSEPEPRSARLPALRYVVPARAADPVR